MFRKAFFCLMAATFALTAQSIQRTRPDASADANDEANATANGGRGQTMKQLVRGTDYAAASMAPLPTLTAEHILKAGGNAFDAIVGGQAVLGLVQPNLNGLGSDATLLIYSAPGTTKSIR